MVVTPGGCYGSAHHHHCGGVRVSFDDLRALFINCTLKRSPELSHTQGLVEISRVIERLYACSSLLNDAGQYAYYGRVGGCLITGNEDGVKHCAMNILYSLQHLGYTIPPQADAGGIPAHGNQRSEWEAGCRFDFDNPDYR